MSNPGAALIFIQNKYMKARLDYLQFEAFKRVESPLPETFKILRTTSKKWLYFRK